MKRIIPFFIFLLLLSSFAFALNSYGETVISTTTTTGSSGSSNISVGGVNTSIQFNDEGQLNGTTDFIYDKTLGNFVVGIGASTSGTNTITMGNNALTSSSSSLAIGDNSIADGTQGVAIGTQATATGTEGISIGSGAQGFNIGNIAIGSSAVVLADYSMAIGAGSNAFGAYSLALGYGAMTNNDNEISIGNAIYADISTLDSYFMGKVGIGTSTPTESLQVIGNIHTTGSNTGYLLNISENTTERVVLDNRGYLGIGTSAPSNMLHIQKTIDSAVNFAVINPSTGTAGAEGAYIGEATTGGKYGGFQYQNSNYVSTGVEMLAPNRFTIYGAYTGGIGIGSVNANGDVVFFAGGIGTTSERMIIKPSGLVGIGNSLPLSGLTINSTGSPLNVSENMTERLYVSSTRGYVGIGTTRPNQTLEVIGNLHTRGSNTGFLLNVSENNTERMVINTRGEVIIGNTNLAEFERDGTLTFNGTATTWDDVLVPLFTAKLPTNQPDFSVFREVTYAYEFQDNAYGSEDEVLYTFQMPHTYKLNSNFEAHLHYSFDANTSGKARFNLTCTKADIDTKFPITMDEKNFSFRTSGNDAFSHNASDMNSTYTCAGVSCIHQCVLRRSSHLAVDTYNSSGVYIHAVDYHIEQDTLGSRTEWAK